MEERVYRIENIVGKEESPGIFTFSHDIFQGLLCQQSKNGFFGKEFKLTKQQNFRPVQLESICRQQITVSTNNEILSLKG